MKRVTGIGGIFIRANDPARSAQWYEKHLGIQHEWDHGTTFKWREEGDPSRSGMTVWSLFDKDTDYFGPGGQASMVNYRVEDLDGLIAALQSEGVWVDDKRENSEFGRFAWIRDCDGNRVELWEPPPAP